MTQPIFAMVALAAIASTRFFLFTTTTTETTTVTTSKTRETEIEFYKNLLQGYMPDLRLVIKKWKYFDGSNYRILYQLVHEDEDSGWWQDLSPRGMKKCEFLTSLITYCRTYETIQRIRFRRHLKAEQELQAKLWEERATAAS